MLLSEKKRTTTEHKSFGICEIRFACLAINVNSVSGFTFAFNSLNTVRKREKDRKRHNCTVGEMISGLATAHTADAP